MNPTSKDICALLAAESDFGLTFGEDLFAGKEPATPDDCVTIFDIPGDAPLLTLDGKVAEGASYNSSIQVRARNNDYLVGWGLIHDIQFFLHGLNNFTEGGATYLLIQSVDEPALLDWDETNRARFIATFSIKRR